MKSILFILLLWGTQLQAVTITNLLSGQVYPTNYAPAVRLAWDATADATVIGYNVYYGAGSRIYTNVVNAGTNLTVVISNLVSGVTFYFAATTYTAAGLESDYSGEATWTPPAIPVPPGGLVATNKVVSVQIKSSLTGQWVESGFRWSVTPNQAAQFYRLLIE